MHKASYQYYVELLQVANQVLVLLVCTENLGMLAYLFTYIHNTVTKFILAVNLQLSSSFFLDLGSAMDKIHDTKHRHKWSLSVHFHHVP
jgi:hypothetical protein